MVGRARPRPTRAFACAAWLLGLIGCVPRAHLAPRAERAIEVAKTPATDARTTTPVPSATVAPAPIDPSIEDTPPTDELVPLAVPTSIEDPSGHALAAFHAALQRAEAGTGQARIAFYGASHVASDMYTGVIRERLQARFGDAGPGFVLPAKPWRWYVHGGVEIARSRGFKALRVTAKAPRDDIYGYAGVALDADPKRSAYARIDVKANEARPFPELRYLEQPGGGHFSVLLDGKPWGGAPRTSTNAGKPGVATLGFGWSSEVEIPQGPRRVELRTHGDGPVRIFGVALDGGRGVVLDTLGVPGARARDHLHWDDAAVFADLVWRHPDLVVLAYGTNESGDDVPIADEEARVGAVIARIRVGAPWASCLLVGPSDRPLKLPDGTYEPRPRTDEIIAMQRRLARAHGCGFFDVVAFMGGPLSMLRWAAATPPLGGHDLVHFTRAGYERLGQVLHDALLQGYAPAAPGTPGAPAPAASTR